MSTENKPPEKPARILPPHLFKKGQSGNPGGRHKLVRQFHDWLRAEAYPKAQAALLDCLEDSDPKVRLAAVKEVNDRLFGRSPQPITGEDGEPLQLDVGLIALLRGLVKHE